MRRWLPAILLGSVIALTACTSSPPESTPPEPSPSATSEAPQPTEPGGTVEPCPSGESLRLTALTLNIHGASTASGDLELDALARELRGWDADVLLLQEVDRGRERSDFADQARVLGQRLAMAAEYGANRQMTPGTSGNAILTRYPVVDALNTALPRQPGLYRRGALTVTVRAGGREIDLVSTHLDHVRPSARRAQAAAVAGVVRRSDRPMLVGGDLNAEPGFPPLLILGRAGLVDAWGSVGSGGGKTVPAADPQRRIDYLLADDSFVPLRSEVLISAVSDHRAVRTTFELLPADC